MIGKRVFWNGNFSNGSKIGQVISEQSGNLFIRWDDGSEMVAPLFTIVERHGWKVL